MTQSVLPRRQLGDEALERVLPLVERLAIALRATPLGITALILVLVAEREFGGRGPDLGANLAPPAAGP